MKDTAEAPAIDPEVVRDDELDLRRPSVPVTVDELAALENGRGVQIIEQRSSILAAARRAAISLTKSEDWLLFKNMEGRVTGYLQDSGCDRVRDILGIEVRNITVPNREPMDDGEFLYTIMGDGYCNLTGQTVVCMEGGRGSDEEFVKDLAGTQKALYVRKAARANLDGNITRELAGLKSVPEQDLIACGIKIEHCNKGKGFGTKEERMSAGTADKVGPLCPKCSSPTRFKAARANYAAFWGCTKYPNCNGTMPDAVWQKELDKRKAAESPAGSGAAAEPTGAAAPEQPKEQPKQQPDSGAKGKPAAEDVKPRF